MSPEVPSWLTTSATLAVPRFNPLTCAHVFKDGSRQDNYSVSLITATLQAAKVFESVSLVPPKPPTLAHHGSDLTAEHFVANAVTFYININIRHQGKSEGSKAEDLAEEQYGRACRIKCKSRVTLVVYPLSTAANWEDQFREHRSRILPV
jgi:hypothetical protein